MKLIKTCHLNIIQHYSLKYAIRQIFLQKSEFYPDIIFIINLTKNAKYYTTCHAFMD